MHTHTCMYMCTHTYIHTCMHTYMHTCIHAYTYMYVDKHVQALEGFRTIKGRQLQPTTKCTSMFYVHYIHRYVHTTYISAPTCLESIVSLAYVCACAYRQVTTFWRRGEKFWLWQPCMVRLESTVVFTSSPKCSDLPIGARAYVCVRSGTSVARTRLNFTGQLHAFIHRTGQ